MSLLAQLGLELLLVVAQVPAAWARGVASATVAQGLPAFASDEGLARFARSTARVDFAAPANQFEAQSNGTFCGPTSAANKLGRRGDYLIVNCSRGPARQRGGGHISPLGAYDAAADSFLMLDANPAAAAWVWISTATLVRGLRTCDTVEHRG